MGAQDYIPNADSKFDIFQNNFMHGVEPKLGDWEIPNDAFDSLEDLQTAWNDAWAKVKNKDTRRRNRRASLQSRCSVISAHRNRPDRDRLPEGHRPISLRRHCNAILIHCRILDG